MKRVTRYPFLPDGTAKALQDALFDHAQALLDAADGRLQNVVSVTATYTAGLNDHVIIASPSGAMTVTLPAAKDMREKRIVIKRVNNTTHTITVQSSAGNIDGAASITLTVAYQVCELFSDGAAWHRVVVAGYLEIPQNSQSANYTTVLADSGKHILHPAADTNARTFTIDSNANVPYPVGTAITFVNETANVLSIAITSDTLTLAGSTSTGTRSIAQNGVGTALKVTSTKWIISGTGIT